MCMVDDCDDFVTTVRDGSWHTARKAHKCAECRRQIGIGERYHSEAFVFDGKFTVHKTCAHCMVARQWLRDECGGWMYGGVEEDVREHCTNGYQYPVGVYRLAIGMHQRWRKRNGSLRPVPAVPMTTHERMRAAQAQGDSDAS